jgi:hypothetical protein
VTVKVSAPPAAMYVCFLVRITLSTGIGFGPWVSSATISQPVGVKNEIIKRK